MAEILGVVASLLGPAVQLGKCIVVPIKRQFNYLCCLQSNIDELRNEAKKLEDAGAGLQMRVTRAQNNAEEIVPEVVTWLEKANENIQVNVNGIETEIKNVKSGCLAVKSRYSLSRNVKKMTEAVKQLKDGCIFNVISQPAPPASVAPPILGDAREFETRKIIEEGIMRALRGEKVKTMGICGMGGVGKTTMARKIMSRVREENLFDETIMAVVSQKVDKLRIQGELAENLGLKLEETNLSSRAHKLHSRLTGGKRILIILDDIWKYLKLEELGIPCETESGLKCTTLLTSRDKGVLINMKTQLICEIETLSETEAWSLFTEKVGANCVDDQNLLSVAREVANQCKGLPIALVNVAMVLEDKKDKSIWEDALEQLKSANPIDLPDIIAEVYNPIKLSYDFLESPHAKSLFLLCCLFPEDYDIPREYLTAYAMGLRMFEGTRNLNQARNKTCSLVEMLKSRFLLLEGMYGRKDHVKMHDIVRDVAIYIASREKRIECSDCTWLSSRLGDQRINELFVGSINFPNLRLVLIGDAVDKKLQINDNFFEKMKELNVLSIKCVSLRSLPQTTELLENLRTLVLSSCGSLETISFVGKLVNLEILICHNCRSVEELPVEIGQLRRLKLLEFSYSETLRRIAPGIISNLVGLEELKILESFNKWEVGIEERERNNAALSELQSLSNLINLEIEIEDFTLAAEHMHISPRSWHYFDVRIGNHPYSRFFAWRFERKMFLDLPREITLANWIQECAKSVEFMLLRGDGSSNLDLGQAQNLRWLYLERCSTVKKLVNITTSSIGTTTVFPHLERLELEELADLEVIWGIDGTIAEGSFVDAFKNLKQLRLKSLPVLKHLWKDPFLISDAVSGFLQQLESLEIEDCEMMEQIFLWDIIDDEKNKSSDIGQENRHVKITFPKLELLKLQSLPNLTTFCKGIERIEFPLLSEMSIFNCPKLKRYGPKDISYFSSFFACFSHYI